LSARANRTASQDRRGKNVGEKKSPKENRRGSTLSTRLSRRQTVYGGEEKKLQCRGGRREGVSYPKHVYGKKAIIVVPRKNLGAG